MRTCAAIMVLALSMAEIAKADDLFVAGLRPFERPAWAPVITEMQRDGSWYVRALTGIEQPYPASLKFLEEQGEWFSPFLHPGMTGRYDIRHWYGADSPEQGG